VPRAAPEGKGKVGSILLRSVTILISLLTVWVVVGSIVYPLWWFEFFRKRGFLNWDLYEYGFTYLLNNVSWLMVALPLAAIAVCLAFRAWLPKAAAFLDRLGIYVILCCVVAVSVDAYWINKSQRLTYETYWGLRNIVEAMLETVTVLAESALPPSQVVPPVDVLYADKDRVAMLYSQLSPEFAEEKRTVTSEDKNDNSFGVQRKPVTLNFGGSRNTKQAAEFQRVNPTTARECIELVNGLLARQSPPYYSTFDQLSAFQLLKQAAALMKSAHDGLHSQSLFTSRPPEPGAAAMLKQMAEIRKTTPPMVIESGIRAQLGKVSGLVIVEGEFRRMALGPHTGEFEEQFKPNPHPISFRFVLRDEDGLRLLPDRGRLLVLGDVIKKWDGGPSLEFHPIAIL